MQKKILELIHSRLKELEWNRAILARRAGLSYNTLLNLYDGKNVSVQTVEKCLKALGINELKIDLNENEED